MSLLIVGSIGIDNIITEKSSIENTLGGSASYAAISASFFDKVNLVGVVGDDFPQENIELFKNKNIDTQGLEIVENGKTFRWTGKYHKNFATRDTLEIHLNVFENFEPKIPEKYKDTPYVLLANIDPELQLMVLDQISTPKFIAADTMDLWLNIKLNKVKELISKIDLIVLNDEEAEQFTSEKNIITAGKKLLETGVKYAVIKKGANGAILFYKNEIFQIPAFPLEEVEDPTGAGDCFIGGLMGYLSEQDRCDFSTIKKGVAFGTITASFNVEAFSLENLKQQKTTDILKRYNKLKEICDFS